MNTRIATNAPETFIENLHHIYDFENLAPIEDLTFEMSAALRMRAGVPLEKLMEENYPSIVPLPSDFQDNLKLFLESHLLPEYIKVLRSTISFDVPVVYSTSELEMARRLGASTIDVNGLKATIIVVRENEMLQEEYEASDETNLFEAICESIDFYSLLKKLYSTQTKNLQ